VVPSASIAFQASLGRLFGIVTQNRAAEVPRSAFPFAAFNRLGPQNITNGIDRHLRPSRIVQSEAVRSIHFDFESLAGNKFVNTINPK
jgi:hypothetical protein